MKDDELIPEEIEKYDQWTVLEALHNCIAHQDYSLQASIHLVEHEDCLEFINRGSFFQGYPDDYILHNVQTSHYRNKFLAIVMHRLGMIDRMGYGIERMYDNQKKRFLPLPDYDLSNSFTGDPQVKLTIPGKYEDNAFAKLLMRCPELTLADALLLDKVQKKKKPSIPHSESIRLKKLGYLEGKYPNIYLSADFSQKIDKKAEYIHYRAQNDVHYQTLLIDYLEKYGEASRKNINDLLFDKLSDAFNEKQKNSKIDRLLIKMRAEKLIYNAGTRHNSLWKKL